MGRIEKEKEDLKVDLQASHTEMSGLRQEVDKAKQEEKRLRQTIYQADVDVGRLKKNIDNVMNERDILGTQVVRRNDELSLQYGRIKVRFPHVLSSFTEIKIHFNKFLGNYFIGFFSNCDKYYIYSFDSVFRWENVTSIKDVSIKLYR